MHAMAIMQFRRLGELSTHHLTVFVILTLQQHADSNVCLRRTHTVLVSSYNLLKHPCSGLKVQRHAALYKSTFYSLLVTCIL